MPKIQYIVEFILDIALYSTNMYKSVKNLQISYYKSNKDLKQYDIKKVY